MARKYIYGKQFANTLDGTKYFFRTVTRYQVDNNGTPIDGTGETFLYYAPDPGQVNSRGTGWIEGTADDASSFNQGGYVFAGVTTDKGKTYAFNQYTQEDVNLGRLPSGKNVGDEVLGPTLKQSLTTSGSPIYEAVQNNLINLAVNTQPGLAKIVSAKQQNTPPPGGGGGGGGGADDETPTDITSIALPEEINTAKSEEKKFGKLTYPEKIENNGQDHIKFEVFKYISQKLSDNNLLFEPRGEYKDVIGTIVLPIQPTIMDANTVTWNDSRMGILEMMGANISLGAMNSAGTDYMTNMAQKFGETIKGAQGEPVSQEVVTAVQNYIAKMAVNSNTNLLSRTGGAITNPNLNLLFESPDLRNFTFNFKLTPRTEREGTIVRKIIRKFKEHMAAQRSVGNLFLETPDVFNISYIRGDDIKSKKIGIHKSLNLFKTCALRSFSVNYTPSGTYMTYNDEAGTMTSYDLTMAFTELEPVYWNDYQSNEIADDQIGY